MSAAASSADPFAAVFLRTQAECERFCNELSKKISESPVSRCVSVISSNQKCLLVVCTCASDSLLRVHSALSFRLRAQFGCVLSCAGKQPGLVTFFGSAYEGVLPEDGS